MQLEINDEWVFFKKLSHLGIWSKVPDLHAPQDVFIFAKD